MIDYYRLGKTLKIPSISRKTSTELILIFLANSINNGVNFVANILIARFLGYEIFGLFSIATNIAMTTLIFSEFGLNLTMVRMYKLFSDDPIRSQAVLVWNFYFKVGVFSVLILASLLIGDMLSQSFMQRDDKVFLAASALVTGGLLGFWSYFKSLFQAVDSMKKIAWLTLTYAFSRLAFLGIYISTSSNPSADYLFFGTYVLPVLLILLVGIVAQRHMLKLSAIGMEEMRDAGKVIFDYSKWVALSGVSFVLIQRNMIFIVAYYCDIRFVSLFAAGLLFTGVFSLMSDSVKQILFPKVAQGGVQRLREYKRKIVRMLPLYALISILLIGLLSIMMYFVLGEKYRDSLPIFWITGIGIAVTTGISFYTIFFHAIMKPKPDMLANFCTLVVATTSGLLVVKDYGLVGVALCYSISLAAGELGKAFLLSRYLRHV